MTKQSKSPFDNILKDLRQQIKERRVKFSLPQIAILLLSIVVCVVLLSTQFGLAPFEIIILCILILAIAGLIFFFLRRRL